MRQRVARVYDVLAPVYDLWAEATEAGPRRRVLEAAKAADGHVLLDIGVGTGRVLRDFAGSDRFPTCIGVDLSSAMLNHTRRRLGRLFGATAHLIQSDARALPFASDSSDIIVSCYMLDLLAEADIPVVLDEFRRVLRPTGRLVIVSMAVQSRLLDSIWRALYRVAPCVTGYCRAVLAAQWLMRGHWQIETREVVVEHGFRSEFLIARPRQA